MQLLHTQLIANAFLVAPLYGICAFAFVTLLNTTRFWPLALATGIAIAPYASFQLQVWGMPSVLSVLGGIATAAAFGVIIEWHIYRRLRAWGAKVTVALLCSLAINTIFESLLALRYGDRPLIIREDVTVFEFRNLGVYLSSVQLVSCLIPLLLLIAVAKILEKSQFGLFRRAIESSLSLARYRHVPVEQTLLLVAAMAFGMAGTAGILLSYEFDLYPQIGFDRLLVTMLIAVSVLKVHARAILGTAILFALAEQYISQLMPSEWRTVLVMALLMALIVIRNIQHSPSNPH